jgi:hypothetical protein
MAGLHSIGKDLKDMISGISLQIADVAISNISARLGEH